jgi:hypothetical protein
MATALPSHQDIADRAYSLFQARGADNGFDLDDWLQAERELLDMLPAEGPAPVLGRDDEDDEDARPAKRVALKKSYPRRAAG